MGELSETSGMLRNVSEAIILIENGCIMDATAQSSLFVFVGYIYFL